MTIERMLNWLGWAFMVAAIILTVRGYNKPLPKPADNVDYVNGLLSTSHIPVGTSSYASSFLTVDVSRYPSNGSGFFKVVTNEDASLSIATETNRASDRYVTNSPWLAPYHLEETNLQSQSQSQVYASNLASWINYISDDITNGLVTYTNNATSYSVTVTNTVIVTNSITITNLASMSQSLIESPVKVAMTVMIDMTACYGLGMALQKMASPRSN